MDDALHELIDLLRKDPYYRQTAAFFEELSTEAATGDAGRQEAARKVVSAITSGELADLVMQDAKAVLPEQSRLYPVLERLRAAALSALHR